MSKIYFFRHLWMELQRSFNERQTTAKPEWGQNGRIIYITQRCLLEKRRRAKELVRMVREYVGIPSKSLPSGALVNINPYPIEQRLNSQPFVSQIIYKKTL